MTFTTLGYAFLGGLLPSFIWLYFLLKEDSRCPEPRRLIALAFIAGMAAVLPALLLEQVAQKELSGALPILGTWSVIEEVLKYGAAAALILWRKAVNEPSDYIIYMLTVALGFAAVENMLFLFAPLSDGNFASGLQTGDLRFLGSTLLHIIASSVVGFALALSVNRSWVRRVGMAVLGLILAVSLHTAFNVLIIQSGDSATLMAFFLVWSLAVVFFAAFEVLKYFEYRALPPNSCPP
ncbi:MAG: PrsW family glutamic-type intramembrane protease [bacterium]|nr:PrsW family glutamic-type intramembrane protease [bacterium]